MTGVLKRYSQYVVHPLKVLLERPICTELIIEVKLIKLPSFIILILINFFIYKAMTRKCGHNFCNYCLTKWLQSSNDCAICRNQVPFASKNHLIDGAINLLVEVSFTKEEKTERGERIQQRSATASSVLGYDLLTDGVDADMKQKQQEAFLMVGRSNCVQSAKLIIQELFKVSDLCSKLRGQEDFRPVLSLIISFSNDFASLYPALRALPESYFDCDISM